MTKPETPEDITATYAWKDLVFAAWGGGSAEGQYGVWVFKRGKQVAELETPTTLDEPVKKLLIFGSWIVGCCSSKLEVWKSGSYEHYTTIMAETNGAAHEADGFTGAICSMPTLLNKVIVGREDGSLDIWNVSTG